MDFKSFDMNALKKLTDPKLAGDLNIFIENLPEKAGQTILIAAGIVWAVAAGAGLFTTVKVQQLTELRTKVKEATALVPIVPKINDNPVSEEEIKPFVENLAAAYKGLSIMSNGSSIVITSSTTSNYGQFREAVGHVQNGGSGWRVALQKFCVGRDCDAQFKLAASLSINKVTVESPPPAGS